jgi:hypothetical protein
MRGLGWHVQQIDDDVFAAIALSRWRGKGPLVQYARLQEHALLRFLRILELAEDFTCDRNIPPHRLSVKTRHRQPGAQSSTGVALEELKAEIVNDGYYRFGDMMAIAHQAIEKCPTLIDRLRTRFPLVLLDEAQDTNGEQLALLDRLFGEGVAFQRLGDQNQILYEDEELTSEDYWRARDNVIPLNQTRRFGSDIASFSSNLTVRAPQQIESLIVCPSRRSLILFDDFAIRDVLRIYAEEVRLHWGSDLPPDLDIRAVASRHSPTRDNTGGWPKTLVDYCPTYRSNGSRTQMRVNLLCIGMRKVSSLYGAHSLPSEIADLIKVLIVRLLRCQVFSMADGYPITKRNLWSALQDIDHSLPLRVQRLIRDRIIKGNAAWVANEWAAFCTELIQLLGIGGQLTASCASFINFVPYNEEEGSELQPDEQRSNNIFEYDNVLITLGSIHSVKGKTVDAILAVETEVYRGRALQDRPMDLATVLPHAFGVEDTDFSANSAHLAAATNIFVAVTRPRHVLALAMRRNAANDALITAAQEQGWNIRDLTARE